MIPLPFPALFPTMQGDIFQPCLTNSYTTVQVYTEQVYTDQLYTDQLYTNQLYTV